MAKIGACQYCGKITNNSPWCSKCRVIDLEDICAEIKEALATGKISGLSKTLAKRIMEGQFQTAEVQKKALEEEENREREGELRALALDAHMQRAAQEFEKRNPNPRRHSYSGIRVKPR